MKFADLPIITESERFKNHLDLENNLRTIFSGIFGIGKTYFIDRFFKDSQEDYISIKINPINYSVSNNEDIFELIKFDIGIQLFSQNIDFEKIEFSSKIISEYFLIENYNELIPLIVKSISKFDSQTEIIVESIFSLKQKINEFQEKLKIDDKTQLKKFLEIFSEKVGTYREENSITQLINKLIEVLKLSNPTKKIVLVIDDLDRIDPDHIFRIMNVFSAHFDHYDFIDENKFGFDKVILICDIKNIRAIFHSRYGTDIDFTGYIDKFYSLEVFYYNLNKIIEENLGNFLDGIKIEKRVNNDVNIQSGYIRNELIFILTNLVHANCLSMRSLVNFLKSELLIPRGKMLGDPNSPVRVYFHSTPILIILYVLEKILGGSESLSKALRKLIDLNSFVEFSIYTNYWELTIGNVVMLNDFENSNFMSSNDSLFFEDMNYDISVSYTIQPFAQYTGVFAKANRVLTYGEDIRSDTYEMSERLLKTKIPYFQLLNDAYSKFRFIIPR